MRRKFLWLTLSVLLLFSVVLFPSLNANAQTNLSQSVSSDALFYSSLNISDKAWEYFNKKFDIKQSKTFKAMNDSAKEEGIDIEKDILSFIGEEIIFAAYPYKDNKILDAPPPFVVAIDIKDTALASSSIAKFLAMAEKESKKVTVKETYAGQEIITFDPKAEIPFCMVLYKNYLIFGSSVDVLKKSIDNIDGKAKTLNTKESFTKIQTSLSGDQLACYVNFENIITTMKSEIDKDKDLKSVVGLLKTYKEMGFGMGIDANGINFKSNVITDANNQILNKILSIPGTDFASVTSITPKSPLFLFAFNTFHYWLDTIKTFLPFNEVKVVINEGLVELKKYCGIDIQKDIINNSNGIFAIISTKTNKVFPADFAIVFGAKDGPKMTQSMKNFKLDFSPETKNKKSVIKFDKALKYRGTNVMMAEQTGFVKETGYRPGYFVKDNLLIFGSDIDILKKLLDMKTNNKNSLALDPYFQSIQKRIGEKGNSLGYIDLKTIIDMALGFAGEDADIKPFIPTLKALKSISMNSYGEKGWSEGILLVDIDMDKINFEEFDKFLAEDLGKTKKYDKISPIKNNMNSFQKLIELFALDNKAMYPKDLAALELGTTKDMLKTIENTVDKTKKAVIDFSIFKEGEFAGAVVYKPIADKDGNISKYEIMGCDETGNLLKDETGVVLKFTN